MERPLCDSCGERPATVYIEIMGADVHQEKRLCAECAVADDLDLLPFALDISPEGEIDISLRQLEPSPRTALSRDLPDERCSECGTRSSEVAGTGLVGCPACYGNLPGTIASLVATVQPGYSAPNDEAQDGLGELSSLAKLQLQLAEAAADEDYERATRLRDTIRRLGG